MNIKKPLPLGISSIKDIVQGDYLYIDKTRIICEMISSKRYNFLARPRRFGKSLLVSTLKEIFSGNRELFANLWIGKSAYVWAVHPVIHIDFSEIDKRSPEKLEASLCRTLDGIAKGYAVDISTTPSSGEKLVDLVKSLSSQGKVVLLVDEYDAAITSNLHDIELAQQNRLVLRSFYGVIKALDEYLRFLLLTGVGKFTQTSVFSGLNNLTDLSLRPSMATLVGYTEEEIQKYLLPYVDDMAANRRVERQVVLDEMRDWYNGYRFSKSLASVYNPFSVFNYLDTQECANYWFASGTPTFLVEFLKRGSYNATDLNNLVADAEGLGGFDIEHMNLVPVFYQTGYLSIQSYSENTHMYRLDYPNKEVRASMSSNLLSAFLNSDALSVKQITSRMRDALKAVDLRLFSQCLEALFANISYSLHVKQEAYYHSIFQIIGTMLGFDVDCEVMTSVGRIDMVINMPATIFIFELKFDKTATEALAQIKERRYAEKYQALGKQIILAGINFSFQDKRLVVAWAL